MAVVFLLFSSYSYCETIIGQTTNAANTGLSWVMTNILPQHAGLTVNAVTYRYTAVKLASDPMVVNVQNLSANGNGYVFRSRDDWTGMPGNTITKTVPTDNIPIQNWGNGEINVEGKGQVVNPSVLYSYRYDTCTDTVVTDPRCPNYRPPVYDTKYTDPYDDEFVQKSLEKKLFTESEEERERNSKLLKKEQQDEKKKSALVAKTVQSSLVTAEAAAQAAALEALNNIPSFALYSRALPGGVYQETLKYVDKGMPDNRNGLRLNLSQDRLHKQLIDLQYNIKSKD